LYNVRLKKKLPKAIWAERTAYPLTVVELFLNL